MDFLYFGNFHAEKINWFGFPVRCFVVYNINNESGEFWERKRNDRELHLEIKTTSSTCGNICNTKPNKNNPRAKRRMLRSNQKITRYH